ncbi:hypothetical protein AXF42_Ash019543 [Apostasia shenzhenica]|uniref:Uncharacterized protein n=1 Tax=Apostasia shenzhenica TaxID=1088818 RepID=A0A2I0A0D0_9ASPA|nr:hypothetical protein AXF42_Ash019543 [Apostasia shenzhenica]
MDLSKEGPIEKPCFLKDVDPQVPSSPDSDYKINEAFIRQKPPIHPLSIQHSISHSPRPIDSPKAPRILSPTSPSSKNPPMFPLL